MPISKSDINEIRSEWAQEGRFDAAYWMTEIIAMLERAVKLEAVAEAFQTMQRGNFPTVIPYYFLPTMEAIAALEVE